MKIGIPDGWPFKSARVLVDGLRTEHALGGVVCLWSDDDPAQIAAIEVSGLWRRVDEWATAAHGGFGTADRALDAFVGFADHAFQLAELPLGDLVRQGSNGQIAPLHAVSQNIKLIIAPDPPSFDVDPDSRVLLQGAFYQRRDVGSPPTDLNAIRAVLTHRQCDHLERGLAQRTPTAVGEPSGGLDFIVLAWPRHDRDHDALVVAFDGHGATLGAHAMQASANDSAALRRRAGPDAPLLAVKHVLVAGAGSVGGHVAAMLAADGVGHIDLRDSEFLDSSNVVRHVCSRIYVGMSKPAAVAAHTRLHAPWTVFDKGGNLRLGPVQLNEDIDEAGLVVDCTGNFAATAALAQVCRQIDVPLITGALFHQGSILRVQRQARGDTLIAARVTDPRYPPLPPEDPTAPQVGFLELGCTAPVNNAAPHAAVSLAAEIVGTTVDYLTGRSDRTDERVVVLRPMDPPFDRTGIYDSDTRSHTTRETRW